MIRSPKLQGTTFRSRVCPSPCHSDRPPLGNENLRTSDDSEAQAERGVNGRSRGLPVSLPLRSPPLGTPECKDNLKKHFDYEAQAARDFCSVQGVPVSLLLRSPLPLGMPECKDNVRRNNDGEAQAAMTMMMKMVMMIMVMMMARVMRRC